MTTSAPAAPSSPAAPATPLVSVLLPVYNAAPYLPESLASIQQQTYTNFELLLYNDGSTDGSLAILNAAAAADARLTVIDGPNRGLVAQLNAGLARARGKYIARMDADDLAPPTRLARQVAYLEAHPEVGLCGGAVRMFGAGVDTVVSLPEDDAAIRQTLCLRNAFFHPAATIRRNVLREHDLRYREDYMTAEDYQLWCEMSRVTQLHNLPDVMLHYRVHPAQVTKVQSVKGQRMTARIRAEQMALLGITLTPPAWEGFELLNQDHRYKHFGLPEYRKISTAIEVLYQQMGGADAAPGVYTILNEQWYNVLQAAGQYQRSLLPVLFRYPLGGPRVSKASLVLGAKCLIGWRPNLPTYLKRYWRQRLR